MQRVRVIYFLEDRTQESIIVGLVSRVAAEEGFTKDSVLHDTHSAGGSRVLNKFRAFIREAKKRPMDFDLIVVACDGNCQSSEKEELLRKKAGPTSETIANRIVFAIPDPHIERWLLLDKGVFKQATGVSQEPMLPQYKCQRSLYKKALRNALANEVRSLLLGSEYGEYIASRMDLYEAGKSDAGLKRFVDSLRGFFRQFQNNVGQ